jgi:hypothetical protein
MAEPFLAQAQRKIAREQAARELRDAEKKAKEAKGETTAARPGFRTRRTPSKKQQP